MFWPSTRPKEMLFQGDAPERSDTFQWPVIERDRVGGLKLIIWDKAKVPLCQYRLVHRKRVTSELHDSYFRLMIKHSISKIQWAIVWCVELLFNSVEFESKKQLPVEFQTARDQMGWGKPHPTEGALGNPDGVDPSIRRTRKTQRDGHNSGVKILQFMFGLSSLSHATLEQPFRTLQIKWEVNIFVKKSSCVFVLASVLLLCRYDAVDDYITLLSKKKKIGT